MSYRIYILETADEPRPGWADDVLPHDASAEQVEAAVHRWMLQDWLKVNTPRITNPVFTRLRRLMSDVWDLRAVRNYTVIDRSMGVMI